MSNPSSKTPKPLEHTAEASTCAWAKNRHIKAVKLNLQGRRGYPDRMFLIPGGRPFFIEFKRVGETLRPLQRLTVFSLKKLGYDVEVHEIATKAIKALELRLLRSSCKLVTEDDDED